MDKTNKTADQTGLENLPEKERLETQKMLDEIAEEDKAKADAPDGDKKPEEEKKPEAPKPDAPKPEVPPTEEVKPRKKAKLVPEYVLRTAESQAQKREEKLKAEIEELKKGKAPTDGDDKSKEEPLLPADVDSELEAISEESGVPTSALKKLLGVVGKATQGDLNKIREDLLSKTKALDEMTSKEETAAEERGFNEDFETNVLPLIKKEYGEDISSDDLSEIKETLKEKAYDPSLVSVPIANLYTGWKEFRGLITPKRKSGEDARGGSERLPDSSALDFDNMTDEKLAGLSDKDTEAYFKHMESKGGK